MLELGGRVQTCLRLAYAARPTHVAAQAAPAEQAKIPLRPLNPRPAVTYQKLRHGDQRTAQNPGFSSLLATAFGGSGLGCEIRSRIRARYNATAG